MLMTPSGSVTLVSELQPENAEFPIFVTLPDIVIFVSELQLLKTELPMLVTPSGIVTLAMESHP
jgi:hypothetical protein